METILGKTEAISQWFMDCTYYAIPRNNNEFKLLLLIEYNKSEKKTYLGAIVLIKNENKATFLSIFNYLETKYNFNPKRINIGCSQAEIIAKKKISSCKNCFMLLSYCQNNY